MDFGLTESQQEIARLAGQLLDEGKADPWKELARAWPPWPVPAR